MKTRLLRRRVIIREYDFNKVRDQALFPVSSSIYDRAEFVPLNKDNLEKIKLAEILRGKTGFLTELNTDLKNPALLLYNLKDYLYNPRYFEWNVDIDEDGFICVQARKNTPRSRIGWGVFEKDLISRL
jgi:hypothetical protein